MIVLVPPGRVTAEGLAGEGEAFIRMFVPAGGAASSARHSADMDENRLTTMVNVRPDLERRAGGHDGKSRGTNRRYFIRRLFPLGGHLAPILMQHGAIDLARGVTRKN